MVFWVKPVKEKIFCSWYRNRNYQTFQVQLILEINKNIKNNIQSGNFS